MEDKRGSQPGSPDWPTRLSSRGVSPAAGSAAALTAALGVGLLIKLARRTRPEAIPEYGERLDWLVDAREQLRRKAEDDASAIEDWFSVQGLGEDEPNRQAPAEALIAVPLEAAELCHAVQIKADPLLQRGHEPTIPDGQAGIRLIRASQDILCTLVEADLGTGAHPEFVQRIEKRLEKVKSRRPEKVACQER